MPDTDDMITKTSSITFRSKTIFATRADFCLPLIYWNGTPNLNFAEPSTKFLLLKSFTSPSRYLRNVYGDW